MVSMIKKMYIWRRQSRAREARQLVRRLRERYPNVDPGLWRAQVVWIRQTVRRHANLTNSILGAIIDAMLIGLTREGASLAELSVDHRKRIRDRFRYAARLASQSPDVRTIDELLGALRSGPASPLARVGDARELLQAVGSAATGRRQRRIRAAVRGADHAAEIRGFIGYLAACTGYPRVPVRFDAIPEKAKHLSPRTAATAPVAAYTDGTVIHLPVWIASTSNRTLNEAFLVCYLAAHEYLHLAAGSYRLDFRSPRGRRLARHLRPLRRNLKRSGIGVSASVREKLAMEGIAVARLDDCKIPGIVQFLRHFPNRDLASWLFNAMEDGRVEWLIRRHWPGLAALHRAHDREYGHEVTTSPDFFSPANNLVQAIGLLAADRPVIARMSRDHESHFLVARQIIERAKRARPFTVYDSAHAVFELYRLLEPLLPEGADRAFTSRWGQSSNFVEEVAIRVSLGERDGDRIESPDKTKFPQEDFRVNQPGLWLPEYDGSELRPRRAHVTVRPFVPTRLYDPLPERTQPLRVNQPASVRRFDDESRRWHADAPHLATDRLPEFRASVKAGLPGTPLMYSTEKDSVPLKVTLLFDLSISMEARLMRLGGDSPIRRAIRFGSWLARNLESQGVEVAAYGGIDGGPRDCQLYELSKPVSWSIPQLRCRGAGGFRLGAFVRAIAAAPAELGMRPPRGRHKLLVLTDGEPGYLAMAMENTFASLHHSNCPNCSRRHRCHLEWVKSESHAHASFRGMFHNQGYDFADTASAIAETQADVSVAYFGQAPPDALVRRVFPLPAFGDVLDAPLSAPEVPEIRGTRGTRPHPQADRRNATGKV